MVGTLQSRFPVSEPTELTLVNSEHYAEAPRFSAGVSHISMSMESCISMAAARCNQTHDDSLVNCATDIRNVRNGMNAVKQHYCLNNKDMKLLFP